MLPLARAALARMIPPERLRWIACRHDAADDCGAPNEWLVVSPHAEAAHAHTGCLVSLDDLADRTPRMPADDETIDLGPGQRLSWIDVPYILHRREAGSSCEEASGTKDPWRHTYSCGDCRIPASRILSGP
jgi:flavorubredoxin